jgi:hypothetical protein
MSSIGYKAFYAGSMFCLLTAALVAGCGGTDEPSEPALPYAREYPGIGYGSTAPGGALGRLAGHLQSGDASLESTDPRGRLDALLAELRIDPSSQVLVFSRTSLQVGHIRPTTPRAIYFNDETFVSFTPGAPTVEIASYEPDLGPVFYSIGQDPETEASMERRFRACLRCHDTYSLSGGGVPRFLIGSGYTGTDGELVSHEAWILTSPSTPLRIRWGGWYVTGRHGDQVHLGNIIVERAEDLGDLESLRVGNVDDLGEFFDTGRYLRPTSDIVALMVLEHQVEVLNLISRLRFESAGRATDADAASLEGHIDTLVRAMLMADEAELTDRIEGSPAYTEYFESLGPFDSDGRSLREFDLETRLFRYPLSYLIYSDAFAGLPDRVRESVHARIGQVLAAEPGQDDFDRLGASERRAIAEILDDTLPSLFAD